MFEAGARPYPPTQVYRAYLDQADVFVGVYWQRYGQLVPGTDVSGLEEEFELSGGLPRLLYVKGPAPDREPRLSDLLARITTESSASYRHFRTPAELRRLVRDDLAVLLSERFTAARQSAVDEARAGGQTAIGRRPRPLPVSMTSLLGRGPAIEEVVAMTRAPGVRLVTLTGPGGVGKTRLAVAVGERLRGDFGAGTVSVPLEAVTDPAQVLVAVGRAAGADLAGTGAPAEALAEMFGEGEWLVILDNLEQVARVAPDLSGLLGRSPGLTLLATSRTALGVRGEREYPVPPLLLPPADAGGASVAEIAAWPAVALFADRAAAVRPGFALDRDNAAAVVEICRRLEGLPLAIELAAARSRLLDPAALLDRLSASLDVLGTGAADLPERQRTLRGTVEWSVSLLEDPERSLLEVTAAFADGWTIPAVAAVAGVAEDRALELSEELARHSLIYLDSTPLGPRLRMLETVRAFAAERLAARPDATAVSRRHAEYYRALAEQADRPLRGAGQGEWLQRLDAERGNLAAAVRWHLANERGPLPHLFRVLWLFWTLRDLEPEGRSWVEQLLPAVSALDLRAQAELEWVAAVTAVGIGDDAAALAACERLASLPATILDPFLRAATQLSMAWALPATGDFDQALRRGTAALRQLRDQDEPVFTAVAAFTVGSLDMALDRHADALGPLQEACDLGARTGDEWLAAAPGVQLGILAVLRGSLDEARKLLAEALDLSLAVRSTAFVTLCLSAYAWLAYADGDPDRAARLAGAAEGLRRRVGLRAWPLLRPVAADLERRVRHKLGGERFDQEFADASGLSQRQAIGLVREQPGGESRR